MPRKITSRPPQDPNQWATQAVTSVTGMAPPKGVLAALLARQATKKVYTKKNPAAVALGRLGGLKGGKARADSLSATQRVQIARKAAKARWAIQKSPTNPALVRALVKTGLNLGQVEKVLRLRKGTVTGPLSPQIKAKVRTIVERQRAKVVSGRPKRHITYA